MLNIWPVIDETWQASIESEIYMTGFSRTTVESISFSFLLGTRWLRRKKKGEKMGKTSWNRSIERWFSGNPHATNRVVTLETMYAFWIGIARVPVGNSGIYNGNIGKADGVGWREAKGIRLSCCLPGEWCARTSGLEEINTTSVPAPSTIFPFLYVLSHPFYLRCFPRHWFPRGRKVLWSPSQRLRSFSPRSFLFPPFTLPHFCFYSPTRSLGWHLTEALLLLSPTLLLVSFAMLSNKPDRNSKICRCYLNFVCSLNDRRPVEKN